jgi:hypothetical protein
VAQITDEPRRERWSEVANRHGLADATAGTPVWIVVQQQDEWHYFVGTLQHFTPDTGYCTVNQNDTVVSVPMTQVWGSAIAVQQHLSDNPAMHRDWQTLYRQLIGAIAAHERNRFNEAVMTALDNAEPEPLPPTERTAMRNALFAAAYGRRPDQPDRNGDVMSEDAMFDAWQRFNDQQEAVEMEHGPAPLPQEVSDAIEDGAAVSTGMGAAILDNRRVLLADFDGGPPVDLDADVAARAADRRAAERGAISSAVEQARERGIIPDNMSVDWGTMELPESTEEPVELIELDDTVQCETIHSYEEDEQPHPMENQELVWRDIAAQRGLDLTIGSRVWAVVRGVSGRPIRFSGELVEVSLGRGRAVVRRSPNVTQRISLYHLWGSVEAVRQLLENHTQLTVPEAAGYQMVIDEMLRHFGQGSEPGPAAIADAHDLSGLSVGDPVWGILQRDGELELVSAYLADISLSRRVVTMSHGEHWTQDIALTASYGSADALERMMVERDAVLSERDRNSYQAFLELMRAEASEPEVHLTASTRYRGICY